MQDGAAALQLFHHVMRGKAAVRRVRVGEQDDDRTIEVAQFFRDVEHRFDDAAAFGRLGPHAEPQNGLAQPLAHLPCNRRA